MSLEEEPITDTRVSLLIQRALAEPETMRCVAMSALSMTMLLRDLKEQRPTPREVIIVLETLAVIVSAASTL